MNESFQTPMELQITLGEQLRVLRLHKNQTQAELAAKAGIAPRSLTNLENGKGSSVETLVRVLKALDATGGIEQLAPRPTISPMALLRTKTPPRRVRRPRKKLPA